MSVAFITSIHRALDVGNDAAPEGMLPSLAAVFAAVDAEARESAIAELVRALNAGAMPVALAEALEAGSTLLNPFRYERSASWGFGTHLTRRYLVDELWQRGSASPDGGQIARAAFLLAAAQGFPFGFATMLFLLADERFQSATHWTVAQITMVRALLEVEQQRTSRFGKQAMLAAETITRMIARPDAMDDTDVLLFFAAAERMAQLADQRADIQMRLANAVWRVWNLAYLRNRLDVLDHLHSGAARWKARIPSPHLARWLHEALRSPAREIRTAGVLRVSESDLHC